jgi:hypothetical protein
MPKAAVVGESPWEYGVGQFDGNYKRVLSFAPMDQFANGAWRGPGGTQLSAQGGHASSFPQFAVIRRWNAPASGKAIIEGPLQHTGAGDGVQGLVVSSRLGPLGTWVASNSIAPMNIPGFDVEEGDTIDFMVYCRANSTGDDFIWKPAIILVDPANADAPQKQFVAETGFQGGAMPRYHVNAWQKFAQVLLETNELTFWN